MEVKIPYKYQLWYLKLKWWWRKHDIVCVWDEANGERGTFYKKVPGRNWWKQAEYRKIK